MKQTFLTLFLTLGYLAGSAQNRSATGRTAASFRNTWTKPMVSTPSNNKVDAPLMGNGDVTMCVGYK